MSGESNLTVAELDAAIRVVLKHQRYKLLDREFTFADLGELRKLRAEVAAEQSTDDGSLYTPVRFQGV